MNLGSILTGMLSSKDVNSIAKGFHQDDWDTMIADFSEEKSKSPDGKYFDFRYSATVASKHILYPTLNIQEPTFSDTEEHADEFFEVELRFLISDKDKRNFFNSNRFKEIQSLEEPNEEQEVSLNTDYDFSDFETSDENNEIKDSVEKETKTLTEDASLSNVKGIKDLSDEAVINFILPDVSITDCQVSCNCPHFYYYYRNADKRILIPNKYMNVQGDSISTQCNVVRDQQAIGKKTTSKKPSKNPNHDIGICKHLVAFIIYLVKKGLLTDDKGILGQISSINIDIPLYASSNPEDRQLYSRNRYFHRKASELKNLEVNYNSLNIEINNSLRSLKNLKRKTFTSRSEKIKNNKLIRNLENEIRQKQYILQDTKKKLDFMTQHVQEVKASNERKNLNYFRNLHIYNDEEIGNPTEKSTIKDINTTRAKLDRNIKKYNFILTKGLLNKDGFILDNIKTNKDLESEIKRLEKKKDGLTKIVDKHSQYRQDIAQYKEKSKKAKKETITFKKACKNELKDLTTKNTNVSILNHNLYRQIAKTYLPNLKVINDNKTKLGHEQSNEINLSVIEQEFKKVQKDKKHFESLIKDKKKQLCDFINKQLKEFKINKSFENIEDFLNSPTDYTNNNSFVIEELKNNIDSLLLQFNKKKDIMDNYVKSTKKLKDIILQKLDLRNNMSDDKKKLLNTYNKNYNFCCNTIEQLENEIRKEHNLSPRKVESLKSRINDLDSKIKNIQINLKNDKSTGRQIQLETLKKDRKKLLSILNKPSESKVKNKALSDLKNQAYNLYNKRKNLINSVLDTKEKSPEDLKKDIENKLLNKQVNEKTDLEQIDKEKYVLNLNIMNETERLVKDFLSKLTEDYLIPEADLKKKNKTRKDELTTLMTRAYKHIKSFAKILTSAYFRENKKENLTNFNKLFNLEYKRDDKKEGTLEDLFINIFKSVVPAKNRKPKEFTEVLKKTGASIDSYKSRLNSVFPKK